MASEIISEHEAPIMIETSDLHPLAVIVGGLAAGIQWVGAVAAGGFAIVDQYPPHIAITLAAMAAGTQIAVALIRRSAHRELVELKAELKSRDKIAALQQPPPSSSFVPQHDHSHSHSHEHITKQS